MAERRSSGRGRLRARGPLTPALAALALAALLAGCGSGAGEGAKLTVYVSAPLRGPRADDGRDVGAGARLALADAGGSAGGVAVGAEVRDAAAGRGWEAAGAGADARAATEDATAIAYIGELDSGASRTSIPITNQAGMLQVSAGAGAEDLTREAPGSSAVPDVQPSGERSFARVIPSDRTQGRAAAVWMAQRGVASTELLGGGTDYGSALLDGFESVPGAPPVVAADARPAAAYDVQGDPFTAAEPGLRPSTRGAVYGSDALLDAGLERTRSVLARSCSRRSECPPGGRRPLRLTSAALDPTQLPAAAAGFEPAFAAEYGREPGRYAAYGYEAMAAVLDSIDRADDPTDRGDVVDAFFAIEDRDSILGRYSIDAVGNTTLAALGAYEVDARGRPQPAAAPLELP